MFDCSMADDDFLCAINQLETDKPRMSANPAVKRKCRANPLTADVIQSPNEQRNSGIIKARKSKISSHDEPDRVDVLSSYKQESLPCEHKRFQPVVTEGGSSSLTSQLGDGFLSGTVRQAADMSHLLDTSLVANPSPLRMSTPSNPSRQRARVNIHDKQNKGKICNTEKVNCNVSNDKQNSVVSGYEIKPGKSSARSGADNCVVSEKIHNVEKTTHSEKENCNKLRDTAAAGNNVISNPVEDILKSE